MKAETRYICKHCAEDYCMKHCTMAKDGKHIPDSATIDSSRVLDNGPDTLLIEVGCKLCGLNGTIWVGPKDIEWD